MIPTLVILARPIPWGWWSRRATVKFAKGSFPIMVQTAEHLDELRERIHHAPADIGIGVVTGFDLPIDSECRARAGAMPFWFCHRYRDRDGNPSPKPCVLLGGLQGNAAYEKKILEETENIPGGAALRRAVVPANLADVHFSLLQSIQLILLQLENQPAPRRPVHPRAA